RTQNLGAAFESVFLDSLRISDLRLTVGDQFWLRSSDANVQLEGSVLVNKFGKQYRFDGTFTAVRGTYTLHIGFVSRDFQVERGTVRYFGTPDLNAELDIQASHLVQAQQEDIKIVANITGTLLLPKLSLESPIRPEPTESELVSYLMFGRPQPEIPGVGVADAGQSQAALETGLAFLGSALSSEIQRTLISDIGLPIDFFEIRTGSGNLFNTSGSNQITAGWQLGNKTFFTINAGFCQDFSNLGTRSFGTGLEYRLSRTFRVQSSYEPVLSCRPAGSPTQGLQGIKYQFGLDVLWEKEY
ncbi:MAG: translocation/assembly module TamB domain-containing protein, partial [Gemmatimonadota bacterium]